MFRLVLTLLIAFTVLLAATSVVAKTSASGLQPADLPCPGNRNESIEANGGAATHPAPSNDAANPRAAGKAARQRWKALLPGTLKSAT